MVPKPPFCAVTAYFKLSCNDEQFGQLFHDNVKDIIRRPEVTFSITAEATCTGVGSKKLSSVGRKGKNIPSTLVSQGKACL